MTNASDTFLNALIENGIDFFCGVPDSVVGKLITAIEKRRLSYLPATCEDAAVGVAAGAYLGGKHPAVLMQNSGLGNALDAYMTLAKLYRLPILFIVSVPHVPEGNDEVSARERANNIHHYDWEQLTKPLLDAVEFPYAEVRNESIQKDIADAITSMKKNSHPFTLIIRKKHIQ